MWLKLEGIEKPIAFDGTEALVPVLKAVLRGWEACETRSGGDAAGIRLSLGAKGYERRSPWIEAGTALALPDPVDAVCDLLLDIKRAYAEDAPKRGERVLSILHGAAVEMGTGENKGLVVFPTTHATGKSLLCAALAHAGHRVFADDQMLLLPGGGGEPARGVAPGFLPRLRRPLPDGLDGDLKTFIRAHEGPTSARFRYIDLDSELLAPLGARAPIKGVVLLERMVGARPASAPATEAEVLKACVLQSFGRAMGALEVLDTLHAMVQGAACVKLTYADASQAVALLEEAFA